MTEYSSHDWRKNTDDAIVVASDIGIKLKVNKSKVIFTNPKTLKTEEVEVSTDAEELKPKPAENKAPRGIETFTICRQSDETGISGTGVVIEGVRYATGQVVLHWLLPFPKGSISIFENLEDFKKTHATPHPTNKTIITWADGRQEEW